MLWGTAVAMGIVLAAGTWLTLVLMFPMARSGQKVNSGLVSSLGFRDSILFLQITLTENWLIFITRADGPFWSSWPSWQLAGAILVVDIIATLFCYFGWFIGGRTSVVTLVRVWILSLGVFCVMAGLYYIMQKSVWFDNFMNGRDWRSSRKEKRMERALTRSLGRPLEDFRKCQPFRPATISDDTDSPLVASLHEVSVEHEQSTIRGVRRSIASQGKPTEHV